MSQTGPLAPAPGWRMRAQSLAGPPAGALGSAATSPGTAAPTAMGLQFELRELTPRTDERWRGPTAQTVTSLRGGHGTLRLGVRPVVLNARGNWVRGSVTWNQLSFHVNRLALNPEHKRWLSELWALNRAVRGVYTSQEADWLYLDDFESSLLWAHLGEARRLGIALVGTKKGATVTVAAEAVVALDVTQSPSETAATAPAESAPGLRLTTTLTIDGDAQPPAQAGAIGSHGVYVYAQTPPASSTPTSTKSPPRSPALALSFLLAPTRGPLGPEQSRLLGVPATVAVPASETAEFLGDFYPSLRHALPVTSTDASVSFPAAAAPVLVLTVRFLPKQALSLAWDWEYREGRAVTRVPLDAGPGPGRPAGRDASAEAALIAAVELRTKHLPPRRDGVFSATHLGTAPGSPPDTLRGLDAAEFTSEELPRLDELRGLRIDRIGADPGYRELIATPELTITTVETNQRDWFDLGVIVTIDGRTVPFGPLFKALALGKPKLLMIDNTYLSLRQPAFERLRTLIDEARSLTEWETGLRISRYQAQLWAEFEDLAEHTEQATAWRSAVSGLLERTRAVDAGDRDGDGHGLLEPVPVPEGVTATLRPYQREGFAWLAFLWKHRLGGILADDMGLGKTLQALALIEHATRESGAAPAVPRRPFLVVAPTSVVSNWIAEAARFTPGLRVHGVETTQSTVLGRGGTTLADAVAHHDVIVTSYTLFRLDFAAYRAQGWAGLILDEAQFLKNHASRLHACARDLDTPFKLAITGTPMENRLLELWSLFAIVAPGLFPSARRFSEEYVRPIENRDEHGVRPAGTTDDAGQPGNPALITRLRRRIRPLILRRTKDVVARELPEKQEQVLRIELNPRHRALYDTFLQRERQKLFGLIEDLDANRFIVFRSLTLLRMLSLDPSLLGDTYADVPSSKLDALFDQLDDVVAEGHRALVFSQFTSFLGKAAARLDAQGTPYCYLDGSTLKRSEVIDRFKSGTAPVFLISLKAGGFGLNLTEADYVFLLDPWWNPATETQAIDRTHRIGQTRTVMVYRLVAADTIEDKVMALKERKARLVGSVLDGAGLDGAATAADVGDDFTAEDIRALLAP
ncbi:DEAD/DEAH box helicase [Cryobacterium sp. MDB1-18-2]|uniref:DEAD/DEAH box helicase n=1 Tax=unclassified Cryobacterium TaxID=2649013 RepID=UPI00106A2C4C|nr:MULTISPECIES: DEAD/DEAH box helicase [unclassified Cryobacterium]TFC27747.1 DEAD/DEAH box helicase [Cryobacterium sp. MDB1-18-2]TFC39221.1 DEAD/DEAH box helicase [Cryobacterium sp. MDB1-18-1]